jgi:hypothetical protein
VSPRTGRWAATARQHINLNSEPNMTHLPPRQTSDTELDAVAFRLLKAMHGLPLSTVRAALDRAMFIAAATSTLDTSSDEFVAAQRDLPAETVFEGVGLPPGWECRTAASRQPSTGSAKSPPETPQRPPLQCDGAADSRQPDAP